MSSTSFHGLSEGDRVRLSDPTPIENFGSGIVFEGTPKNTKEITVTVIHRNMHGGISAIEDEAGEFYLQTEGYEVKVIEYSNYLPDADYIVWADADRNRHVAYRDGHPKNNVWVYFGNRLMASELAEVVGSNTVYVLAVVAKFNLA